MRTELNEEAIREGVKALIVDKVGVREKEIISDADIEEHLGCTGDDFDELMEAYAKQFNVDMTGYQWYFHMHDESMATINPMPGNPPSQQVKRIPITLNLLVERAILGRWDVSYPIHSLKPRYTRWEKVFHRLFVIIVVFLAVRSCT